MYLDRSFFLVFLTQRREHTSLSLYQAIWAFIRPMPISKISPILSIVDLDTRAICLHRADVKQEPFDSNSGSGRITDIRDSSDAGVRLNVVLNELIFPHIVHSDNIQVIPKRPRGRYPDQAIRQCFLIISRVVYNTTIVFVLNSSPIAQKKENMWSYFMSDYFGNIARSNINPSFKCYYVQRDFQH